MPATAPIHGIRVVAFDLDSTLVDILRVKERAAEAAAWALADEGLGAEPGALARDILVAALELGIDREDVVDEFLRRRFGAVDARLAAVARHAYEAAEEAAARPYPRAHRTLVELARRGYRLVLVTDAPRGKAIRRLSAARLLAFFSDVVAREDTDRGKADAAPFALAARLAGAQPHEILMVGDNPERDVAVARAFGCRTVLAAYGVQPHFASDRLERQADRRIEWLDELLDLLPERASDTASCERP